jgi:hypothetical protein
VGTLIAVPTGGLGFQVGGMAGCIGQGGSERLLTSSPADRLGQLNWDELGSDLGGRGTEELEETAQGSNPRDWLASSSALDEYFAQTADDYELVLEDE